MGGSIPRKIHEPRPEDILDLEPEDYQRILNIPMSQPALLTEQDSKFIAYTTPVANIKEVQDGYTKIRLLNPSARHVICAYQMIVDGKEENDGCDDQEPGASRNVLQLMHEHDLKSRVFYIARYCGKAKLSSKRFECYVEAAKMALIQHPNNKIIGCEQKLKPVSEIPRLPRRNKKPNEKQRKYNKNPAPRGAYNTSRGRYRGGSKHQVGWRRNKSNICQYGIWKKKSLKPWKSTNAIQKKCAKPGKCRYE